MAGLPFVRIALLSDCYLPRLGGIEVQVHDLAQRLVMAGHDVEVFTATGDGARPRSSAPRVEDGVPVHRFDLGLPGGLPVNPLAAREVSARLRGFDVAHVHMGIVSPFAADMARVALGAGVATAITWHCVIDTSAPLHRAAGYAARWAERGAALSAVSGFAADRVARIVGPRHVVTVLPDGVDVPRWRRPEGHPGPASPPLRIVAAQRMAFRKRPAALVDIVLRARELVPADVGMQAVVVGDGPAHGRLVRRVRRAGADWIELPGRVSREVLRELYWDGHVFVSATRLEAFGLAALEARAAGLALVVRAGTGAGDFVSPGRSGLLADSDEAMARAIADLARAPDLLAAMQDHNRSVAPEQDWPQVLAATLAEYDRALAVRVAP